VRERRNFLAGTVGTSERRGKKKKKKGVKEQKSDGVLYYSTLKKRGNRWD